MSLNFFIPGTPVPQGSKKWVGRMIEANTQLGPWRSVVTAYTRQTMLAHKTAMLDEPLYISMTFYLRRPKAHYRTGKNSGLLKGNAPVFVQSTPDLDKLIRAVNDGITDAGLWKDDSLVVSLNAQKRYAEQPGVNIWIVKMSDIGEEDNAEANDSVASPLHGLQLDIDDR